MNPITPFSILVFSFLIRITLCSVNPKFQACEPKTCGNGQDITYPFYIVDKQDPSCGFPTFGLLCASNGFPMLNLSDTLYIVDKIHYRNHSLRVSNPNFPISNSTNCLAPSNNLTVGFRYTFAPNQKEVLLFFDCDLSSLPREMKENIVGCSGEDRTRSVLGLAVDDEEKKLKYTKDHCHGEVMKTMVENMEGRIREALGRGFVLKSANWTTGSCDPCKTSGGWCGFDLDGLRFLCHCPDRDHHRSCHSGLSPSLPRLLFHYHFFVFNAQLLTAAFSC